MTFLIGALKIIIVLGTLITIHELGHFFAARLFGVRIHKFAIGFGPKIYTKTTSKTEYTLRLIPFGGFVQLEGEEKRGEGPDAYNNKPIWKRMIIISAGAFVNIVFALVVYFIICLSSNIYVTSEIAYVEETSFAYEAGLRKDDKILKINNKSTLTNTDVVDAISNAKSDDMIFYIERDGKKLKLPITIDTVTIGNAGVALGENAEIMYLIPGGAAEEAGILVGDKILSIDEFWNLGTSDVIDVIRKNPSKKVLIVTKRGEDVIETYITPDEKTCRLFDVEYKVIEPTFFVNLRYAIDETGWYFNETISRNSTNICG